MMKIYGIEIRTEMKNKSWKNPFPNHPSYVKREKDQKWNIEFYDDKEFAIESIETKVNEEGSLIVEMTGAEESLKKLDIISKETNRSRNELINIMFDWAIENCEIK